MQPVLIIILVILYWNVFYVESLRYCCLRQELFIQIISPLNPKSPYRYRNKNVKDGMNWWTQPYKKKHVVFSLRSCVFLLANNKFSALNPPQEAIVSHSIAICDQYYLSCIYWSRTISPPLPPLPHKKGEIKLDPPVSAGRALPLWCDSVTLWLSSWHSCPPTIIPLLHAHFLLSFIIPMSYLTWFIIISAVF